MFERLLPNEVCEIERAVLLAERDGASAIPMRPRQVRAMLQVLRESSQRETIQDFEKNVESAQQRLRQLGRQAMELENDVARWKRELDEAKQRMTATAAA